MALVGRNKKKWLNRPSLDEERMLARAGNQMSGAMLRERFARQYNIKSSRLAHILQLAVRGRSNEEIAHELNLAPRTVKMNMMELYQIVGVKTRAGLLARWHG
jgi:ATP/maltotriose-dependent transcriptional regulator MalT